MAEEVAQRRVLLESLAEWIEEARDTDEDRNFVETTWACGFDPEYWAVNIQLLPEKYQTIWKSLRTKRRPR
jgi:hypothetical protein